MYLWFLIGVAAVAKASSSWDPCDVQCKDNFENNEQYKQTLIPTCKTGCKLFTEAFETTSECQGKRPEHQPETLAKHHPRVLPLTSRDIHLFKIEHQVEPQKGKKGDGDATAQNSVPGSPPSNTIPQQDKNSNKIQTVVRAKSEKQTRAPTSKTTVEPTSQPVQDLPVEASRQTTTTNNPRRESAKGEKKEGKTVQEQEQKGEEWYVVNPSGRFLVKKEHPKKSEAAHVSEEKKKNNKDKRNTERIEKQNPEWKERVEVAKHCCRRGCVATFKNAMEHESCVVGCNLQATKASLNPLKERIQEADFDRKSPFGMFQRVIFNLAGHVGKIFRVSWSWISSAIHTKPHPATPQVYGSEDLAPRIQMPIFIPLQPVLIQEEAHRRIEKIKIEQNNAVKLFNEDFFHRPHSFEVPLSASDPFQNTPRIITILRKESITRRKDKDPPHFLSKLQPDSRPDPKRGGGHFPKLEDSLSLDNLDLGSLHPDSSGPGRDNADQQQIQHQLDLLECISRKSGLPRWFIAITIFTSAIVVLWLCFSLTAPPDDVKVVKTKPPELETLVDDDDDYDDDDVSCSEKKKLLSSYDDVIKIRIENV